MTRAEAEELVMALIAQAPGPNPLAVVGSEARPWGFVVHYGAADGQPMFGGGPYLVTHEGQVFTTGSRLPDTAWEEGMLLELGRVAWWKLPFALIRSTIRRSRPCRIPDDDLRRAGYR
jgi:hypothetical protein